MAPSTFHSFSRLPCELRLQIWEAACFPSSRYHRGLHYIDVNDNQRLEKCREDWVMPPEDQNPGGQANRSAYIWDEGLWTTCKESREVIKRHSRIEDWLRIQVDPGCKDPLRTSCEGDWVGGREAVPPGKVTIQRSDETSNLLVYPARDMFCIKTSDWCKGTYFYMDICVPFIRSELSELLVQNIALEFDSSWNSPFPTTMFQLSREDSARGPLAKMLLEVCLNPHRSLSNIWIIDKTTHWVKTGEHDLRTVYHDCDDEYVEVGWFDTRSETTERECYGDVTKFMIKLGEWADGYMDDLGRINGVLFFTRALPLGEQFEVAKAVRLLVRRSNELSEVTDVDNTCAN
ncbi:hypothetical protein ACHAPJ_013038 [Fusarium lateritium]